jgi:hypothetical protein
MSQRGWRPDHSPIAKLVGLVEAVRLLEERIGDCVEGCHQAGYGATEVARILGVHRATVYRLASWRDRSERDGPEPRGREAISGTGSLHEPKPVPDC